MSDGKGRRPLTSKERKSLEKQRKNAAKQAEKYHKEKAKQDKRAKKSPNPKKEQQKKAPKSKIEEAFLKQKEEQEFSGIEDGYSVQEESIAGNLHAAGPTESITSARGGNDSDAGTKKPSRYQRQKALRKVKRTINEILDKFSDDDDWIFSGRLGDQLSKRLPDFDVRNYGFSKFIPFISSLGDYEISEVWDNNRQKQIYVRKRK